jgi:sulfite dehydrogenase (cytochrome) subunit B
MKKFLLISTAALIATSAIAEEKEITLKAGPGRDKVEQNCAACHSLDYIQMNSSFQKPETWEAEVKKMRGPFGAPITDDDAKAILDYLNSNYGVKG